MAVVKFLLAGKEHPFKHKYNTLNKSSNFQNVRPLSRMTKTIYNYTKLLKRKKTALKRNKGRNRVLSRNLLCFASREIWPVQVAKLYNVGRALSTPKGCWDHLCFTSTQWNFIPRKWIKRGLLRIWTQTTKSKSLFGLISLVHPKSDL